MTAGGDLALELGAGEAYPVGVGKGSHVLGRGDRLGDWRRGNCRGSFHLYLSS